jgi:hypothetical protein
MKTINKEEEEIFESSNSDGSDREDYKVLKSKNKKRANIGQTLNSLVSSQISI